MNNTIENEREKDLIQLANSLNFYVMDITSLASYNSDEETLRIVNGICNSLIRSVKCWQSKNSIKDKK